MSPEEARQKPVFEAAPAPSADVDGFRARVPRRVALRLLPFLFLLYVVAFLDRMNVGAAALQMPLDLGFSEQVLGLGAGIFFLGYFCCKFRARWQRSVGARESGSLPSCSFGES